MKPKRLLLIAGIAAALNCSAFAQQDEKLGKLSFPTSCDPKVQAEFERGVIQNYIGYAHRKLRQLGPAMQHYQQALLLNRRHRSATEHLGELYLVLGEPTKAEDQLARLADICLIPCTETDDLKRAIAAYNTSAAR